MIKRNFEEQAKILINAIKAFDDNSLENLYSYLSIHFDAWLDKYANSPDGLAYELKMFSEIK